MDLLYKNVLVNFVFEFWLDLIMQIISFSTISDFIFIIY